MNIVASAIKKLGGDAATSRRLKKADGKPLTAKAVRKWRILGKLPWSEATGKTNYAEQMAAAHPEIDKDKLLSTVHVKKKSVRVEARPVA